MSNWSLSGAGIVYSLVITPIVVKGLHTEFYGIWSFLNGLLAYSELLYFGLGSAVVRNVARHRAASDDKGINRLLSVVLTIYGSLGACCFVTFLVLSRVVPPLIAGELGDAAQRAVMYTCWCLGLRLLLVFITSAFAGLIYGHDRFDRVNAVGLTATAMRFVVVPLSLRTAQPLIGLAVATAAVALCETLLTARIAFRLAPRIRVRPTMPNLDELRGLYGFGVQSFLIVFAIKLISYTDTTVIGIMLGATSVGMYVLPLQLVEYGRFAVGGLSGVLLPRLTVLVDRQDTKGVKDAYLRVVRIGGFMGAWAAGVLIALGVGFLNLWVGPEYAAPARWVLMYLAAAGLCQTFASQLPFAFYQALGLLTFPAKVLFVEGVLNLVLSISLVRRFGIDGVAAATLIPAACVSAIVLPTFMCRVLGIRFDEYLKHGLRPALTLLPLLVASQWFLDRLIPLESYWLLILRAGFTVPIAASVFAATFPREESRQLIALCTRRWR